MTTEMDEYEAMAIYDNEIAPLEQLVDILSAERDALRVKLEVVKFNLKLLFNADYESMEWNACYDRLMDYSDNDNFAALTPKETDR